MIYSDAGSPFIDAHCHLFNVDDIPLYESVLGKVRMGTIDALLGSIIAGAAVSTQQVPGFLESQRNFIRFFERDIPSNILWLNDQLVAAVQGSTEINVVLKKFGYTGKRIVVTPLIMDFDKSLVETDLGRDVSCKDQARRLFHAIAECDSALEIYPFFGFALNKLDDNLHELEKLQLWWKDNGIMKHQRVLGMNNPLPAGKAIGIKLYPPLGFNPYPEGQALSNYIKFYEWCISEDIPLTVHCQRTSFTAAQNSALIDSRTNPSNWEKLFLKYPSLSKLRINFGHFGGTNELIKMMRNVDSVNQNFHLADSWSLTVCKLLCQYENTYADISAFGFEESKTLRSLALLLGGSLDLPQNAWLKKLDLVAKKIIWGSDLPMILSSPSFLDGNKKPSYQSVLTKLLNGLIGNDPFNYTRQTDVQILFNRLTRSNPAEFLFGSA